MKYFGILLSIFLILSCSKDFDECLHDHTKRGCVVTENYNVTFIVSSDPNLEKTIVDTLPIIYDGQKNPLAFYHQKSLLDTIIYESNKPKYVNRINRTSDSDYLIFSVEKFYNENQKLSVEIKTKFINQTQTTIEIDSLTYDDDQNVATRHQFRELFRDNKSKGIYKIYDEQYEFEDKNLVKITRNEYTYHQNGNVSEETFIETTSNYTNYNNPWCGSPYPFQFKYSLSKNTYLNKQTFRSDGLDQGSQIIYDNGANEFNYPILGFPYLCD